jgi:hypothetical protein
VSRRYQSDTKRRILNDRPDSDVQIPRIMPLYSLFPQFFDDARDSFEKEDDIDVWKQGSCVNKFSSVMSLHYTNEDERQEAVLRAQ